MRSPIGVALQGTPALLSTPGFSGFCSSMRGEREERCLHYFGFFLFNFFLLFIFYLWGSKNGLQQPVYDFP